MARGVLLLVAVLATLIGPPGATGSPGLAVGANENELFWNTADTVSVARYLGLKTMAVTLDWEPRMSDLEPVQIDALNRAVTAAGPLRLVLGIHNNWQRAPVDEVNRQQYCTFAANVLRRYPQINDIIIWNEPNVGFFWSPQFDAGGASASPKAYFELAAHCYDVLHGVRPSVNIVGPVNSHAGNDNPNAHSNITHSPPRFIRELGAAYRASGRTRPIFDTLGHHPYPRRSDEHPSVRHEDPTLISIGDTGRLIDVMREAFGGTAQRIPDNGLPIWYLETGYQTTIPPAKAAAYDTQPENWPGPVPDVAPGAEVDQAKQLTDSLRLMYCQPHVEAIFNFLLKDEREMARWQSGVFWADGSAKGSLEAYRSVISEVNDGRVNCGTVPGAGAPPVTTVVPGRAPSSAASGGSSEPRAQRSVTTMTYRGSTRATFGGLQLRARLTRGATKSDAGLSARQLTFVVDDETYLTTTNAEGVASIVPSPPIRPGAHRIEVGFRGDEISLGSTARTDVQVVNSRGSVTSTRRLRLASRLQATIVARSNGGDARGTLTLRRAKAHRCRSRRSACSTAAAPPGSVGRDGQSRYDVHLRRLPSGKVRIQIWRDGSRSVRRPRCPPARCESCANEPAAPRPRRGADRPPRSRARRARYRSARAVRPEFVGELAAAGSSSRSPASATLRRRRSAPS